MADTCTRVEPLLSAWIDGELCSDDAALVAVHLDGCGQCSAQADRLASVRSLVRSLPVRRLPDPLRSALAAQVETPSQASALTRVSAALAVAAGLLGGAVFALGGQPPSDSRPVAVPMDVYVADHVVHSAQDPLGSPTLVGLRK
jgi:anti-sigma factor RsiW